MLTDTIYKTLSSSQLYYDCQTQSVDEALGTKARQGWKLVTVFWDGRMNDRVYVFSREKVR